MKIEVSRETLTFWFEECSNMPPEPEKLMAWAARQAVRLELFLDAALAEEPPDKKEDT